VWAMLFSGTTLYLVFVRPLYKDPLKKVISTSQ
jgi:hypothetical protein